MLRKTEYILEQKELETKQLTETVERLKFDLEEMRKRVNGSPKGSLRPGSIRSIGTIGILPATVLMQVAVTVFGVSLRFLRRSWRRSKGAMTRMTRKITLRPLCVLKSERSRSLMRVLT
jgi:hypothetical protein